MIPQVFTKKFTVVYAAIRMKGGSFNYCRIGSIDVAAIVRQPEVKCGNIFAGMWACRFEMHDKMVALLNCVLKFMIRRSF